ncbi:MAG TPA: PucR family transcriptional regulator ligand-binding domain-containing protein [Gaiellales bacterium]
MLTVAQVLALDPLELRLAGGGAGLGRHVRWAHISELDDPTPWLRGGELLLTTGRPLTTRPDAFVERLASHGLAGLCLGLGFGIDEMPAEAAGAADRLGFPVMTTPYHVPFIAITEAVFRAQADARVQALERLTALMLDGRDLESMLAEMGRLSDAALCLREPSGRVLARTSDMEDAGAGAQVLPVVTGSVVEAELVARPGDRCDPQLLHHLQTVLAVELLKRRAVSDAERRLSADLVDSILAGEVSSSELRRKAGAFGLEGEQPMAFALLRPAERGTRALAALAARAEEAGPCVVRDGGVAVLIEAADDERAELRARELLAETGAGSGGVGRVRRDPAELRRSYDEALYAAEARPANGHPTLATFRDLGSIQLLLSLQDERGVQLYCDSLLGPLIAHDAAHGSALVESLRAYIEANGRWAEAAAALSVHRHTLRYRMRKISELTGRDLGDAGDRLELWLALRADQLRTPPLAPSPLEHV